MSQLAAVKKKCKLFVVLLIIGYIPLQAQLTANFIADKSGGCSPLNVSFTNLTTGASANAVYHWDFGNGNTSSLKNSGAIYRDEKTYNVTLTVIDGLQTSSKTASITVYKKPIADFSVSSPKVCIPDAAIFISNSTPGMEISALTHGILVMALHSKVMETALVIIIAMSKNQQ
ncbi:MAG TPA: PKD domain-containing protein [Chitinophagaceae bacterium]|jgi:PKD repeat protein|nr:PKD domain-containing protein [Chitinophagaceae bacterium]